MGEEKAEVPERNPWRDYWWYNSDTDEGFGNE